VIKYSVLFTPTCQSLFEQLLSSKRKTKDGLFGGLKEQFVTTLHDKFDTEWVKS
jgi:hypothetical protein